MNSLTIEIFAIDIAHETLIPFIEDGIKAGFPSPADDFLQKRIDLNRELIKNPETTFLGKVSGNSLQEIGIFDGDLMLIDRSINPKNDHIAVCIIDGEFTLKRLKIKANGYVVNSITLQPENQNYEPIKVNEFNDFKIWGILTHTIKKYS